MQQSIILIGLSAYVSVNAEFSLQGENQILFHGPSPAMPVLRSGSIYIYKEA